MSDLKKTHTSQRLFVDRMVARLVSLGGAVIIFSIMAIFLVLIWEVYPLFKKVEVVQAKSFSLPDKDLHPLAIGVDEYQEVAYFILRNGIAFYSLKSGKPLPTGELAGLNGAEISGVSGIKDSFLFLGLADGRILPVKIRFNVSYNEGVRNVEPEWTAGEPIVVDAKDRQPISLLASHYSDTGFVVASIVGKEVFVIKVKETTTMMGTVTKKESRVNFALPTTGEVTALLLDKGGKNLFVGTASGQILRASLDSMSANDVQIDTLGATSRPGIGVSVLGFLVGKQTLVVGDEAGEVNTYHLMQGEDERYRIRKIHGFARHPKTVAAFYSSTRDKGFVTGDTEGTIHYHYATTGETEYTIHSSGKGTLVSLVLAPKANGILTMDSEGSISHWKVDNPHPEVSWRTLFGKVLYEGYPEKEYVWQSTGGTDDFESKLSLVPLIFGTLKGTFYALMFAVPIALFSAFYTSQFMHPSFKNIVKPVLEIMAALPSVVLGFFSALWLAPKVEKLLPGLVISPFVLVALVSLTFWIYQNLPPALTGHRKPGSEIIVLIFLVAATGIVSTYFGGILDVNLPGADYRVWLKEVVGVSYDQRNSIVVGLAMGFAVIPIIFTISEDSLSNVPRHLSAASLALGATRWQTAINVILPTASPGIFSAIMIGFGRAVGETMIVLMATGNTPVMDLSPFDGFRALSANIAVELPEAPEGGTLFRVLFLAALLLFAMTFAVNTAAEWVRLKLRERYRVL